MNKGGFFYGWVLVGVAWVLYGFGISPGYYSWGFFSPEIASDLNLTRGQTGLVFGLFTFIYSGIGPITGTFIARWGTKRVMVVGSLLAATGFLLLRGANSLAECVVYYSVIAGIGIGLSTILPCQTLATHWFSKYRATALAIIFIAGGVVGKLVTRFDAWMLENYSWRTAWVAIAAISAGLAMLAGMLVRNKPEDIGQHVDGIAPTESDSIPTGVRESTPADAWTPGAAMRTPQFAVLCLSGISYGVPWGVAVAHGRFHLQDMGFSTDASAAVLGTMILVSIAGRLSGSLADLMSPEKFLGCALLIEAAGMAMLMAATNERMAYLSTILIALGFGASYIVIAVVFSRFFGRVAFAQTTGTRFLIGGVFGAFAPALSGWMFDRMGSYQIAFISLAVLGTIGGIATLNLRPPKLPAPHTG